MIFFITALPVEAKPFIRHYRLKKDQTSLFNLFVSENVKLIVSGTGKVQSAAAVTHLLTVQKHYHHAFLVNAGFAGSPDLRKQKGSPWMINQITDESAGRTYYPDMLWKHPFPEASLTTVDRLIGSIPSGNPDNALYDMEASGCFQAAARFLKIHQMAYIKIVSDHCSGGRIPINDLSEMMHRHADNIIGFAEDIHTQLIRSPLFEEDDSGVLELKRTLKLTETQVQQLRQAVKAYRIRHNREFELPAQCLLPEIYTQASRDITFEKLLHELYR